MTPERARGYLLYAVVGVLVAAAGVWFFRSAPYLGDDPRVRIWQATVLRLVPDQSDQAAADTVLLGAGAEAEARATVRGGSFTLAMVCAGEGRVRVRLSTNHDFDSGKAVTCSAEPEPMVLSIALGTTFYLSMESETAAAAFRWQLLRAA